MLMDLCVVLRMHPKFRQFKVALAFTLYKAPSGPSCTCMPTPGLPEIGGKIIRCLYECSFLAFPY